MSPTTWTERVSPLATHTERTASASSATERTTAVSTWTEKEVSAVGNQTPILMLPWMPMLIPAAGSLWTERTL